MPVEHADWLTTEESSGRRAFRYLACVQFRVFDWAVDEEWFYGDTATEALEKGLASLHMLDNAERLFLYRRTSDLKWKALYDHPTATRKED